MFKFPPLIFSFLSFCFVNIEIVGRIILSLSLSLFKNSLSVTFFFFFLFSFQIFVNVYIPFQKNADPPFPLRR